MVKKMSRTVTIHIEKPIAAARLLDVTTEDSATASAAVESAELLEHQKKGLSQVCQALQDAVNKVNEFQESLFKRHKEQIAKLSVEITRKILAQKVQEGDYEIEPIIEEALKNTPTRQDVVVRLNPEDLAQYQKAQQDDDASSLADIKFVPDANIGRAECVLETPKGVIESLIEAQLERIGKALIKAE